MSAVNRNFEDDCFFSYATYHVERFCNRNVPDEDKKTNHRSQAIKARAITLQSS